MKQKGYRLSLAEAIATCGGVGYLPKCPGTYGALLALVLWSVGKEYCSIFFQLMFLCTAISLGGMAVFRVLHSTPEKDPSYIVIDEFLGQLLALVFIPQTKIAGLWAFILFRLLDIKKMGAIRSLDAFSKRANLSPRMAAICILGDDLLAGLCAGVLVRVGWWIAS